MSAHVEFHDPTVAAVSIAPPFHTWDGATPVDEDRWDADAAIDEGHYGLVIDCVENVAVFEGTPAELRTLVERINSAWAAFTANLDPAELGEVTRRVNLAQVLRVPKAGDFHDADGVDDGREDR